MPILSSIVGWLVGTGIDKLTGSLLKWYEIKANATTESEKIAAGVEIERLEKLIEINKGANEIRQQTAGYWEQRVIAFMFAFPFAFHIVVVGLDTIFKFGWAIDKFPAPMDQWQGLIALSYFGVQLLAKPLNNITAGFAQWMKK